MTFKNQKARALAGMGALTEVLDMIGAPDADDHTIALIISEHEIELRALLDEFSNLLVRIP
jgi:hypothetical protein